MRTFKDNQNREWIIAIDDVTAGRVLQLLRFDLRRVLDNNGAGVHRLATDLILFVNVLYVLCESQAEAAGLSDVEFGRALHGCEAEAADALLGGFVDMTPDAFNRQRLEWLRLEVSTREPTAASVKATKKSVKRARAKNKLAKLKRSLAAVVARRKKE